MTGIETLNDLLELPVEKAAEVLALRVAVGPSTEKTAADGDAGTGGMLSSLGSWIQRHPGVAGALLGGGGLGVGSALSTYLANRNRDERDRKSVLNSLLSGSAVGAALGGGAGLLYGGLTGNVGGGSATSRGMVSFRGPDGRVHQIPRSAMTPELQQRIESIMEPSMIENITSTVQGGIPAIASALPTTTFLGAPAAIAHRLWDRGNRITEQFSAGVRSMGDKSPLFHLPQTTHRALSRGFAPDELRTWQEFFSDLMNGKPQTVRGNTPNAAQSRGLQNTFAGGLSSNPSRAPGQGPSRWRWSDLFLSRNAMRPDTDVLATAHVPHGTNVSVSPGNANASTGRAAVPITRAQIIEANNVGGPLIRGSRARGLATTAALIGGPLLFDLFINNNLRAQQQRQRSIAQIIEEYGANSQQQAGQ